MDTLGKTLAKRGSRHFVIFGLANLKVDTIGDTLAIK